MKPEKYDEVVGYDIIKPYVESMDEFFEDDDNKELVFDENAIIEVEETRETKKITRKKKTRSPENSEEKKSCHSSTYCSK